MFSRCQRVLFLLSRRSKLRRRLRNFDAFRRNVPAPLEHAIFRIIVEEGGQRTWERDGRDRGQHDHRWGDRNSPRHRPKQEDGKQAGISLNGIFD